MYEVCHAMVLFPEVEGNRGVCTPFFAYHGGTVCVFDCQWPGVHRLYVSSCQAGYLFFSDLVWFHFSHMLVFLLNMTGLEPVFLFLTCSGLSFAMIAQGLAKKNTGAKRG